MGFALTLPTGFSWGPVGKPLVVEYEAPQGRRLNGIGGYFSHGPMRGEFLFETWASLPKSRSQLPTRTLAEQAARHGLAESQVGSLDGDVLVAFLWRLAGRPKEAGSEWRRERPLVVVMDNYSVHKSQRVQQERERLQAADVFVFYLPPYSPQMSRIEPIWQDVKYHQLPTRSQTLLGGLKSAVDTALMNKALQLRAAAHRSAHSLRGAP